MKSVYKILFSAFVCCLSLLANAQHPQGIQTEFGKNRVQYQDFAWNFYRSKNFDTYFYLGGKQLAIFTTQQSEKILHEIEKFLDYRITNRIIFIVYNKLGDLKQTNIGIESEQYNTGGITKIIGNKAFLYFDGDHNKFEKQLRGEIARIIINEMLFGGDLKEMMQNSTLLALPDWYIDGLVSFFSEEWNCELDNKMRDAFKNNKLNKFSQMEEYDPILAGHTIWYYIATNYGYAAISNIIYMTRINRNIESGFLFVLGASMNKIGNDWLLFYYTAYMQDDTTRYLPQTEPLLKKPKNRSIYSEVKISPDGKQVAYSTNKMGLYRVYIYDIQTKKRKRIFKTGYKSYENKPDYSYPLLCWHPSGRTIAMVYEKKSNVFLAYYNIEEKQFQHNPMPSFEKILSLNYSDDASKMVMSAIQQGHVDIFIFNPNSRVITKITDDLYDEFNPQFIHGSSKIIFSSNRPDDTLRNIKESDTTHFMKYNDLFIYDYNKQSDVLTRLINTPYTDELMPTKFDSIYISFISNDNGIQNLNLGRFDSVFAYYIENKPVYKDTLISTTVSNYSRNMISCDRNIKHNISGSVFFNMGNYYMYIQKETSKDLFDKKNILENTKYRNKMLLELQQPSSRTDTIILGQKQHGFIEEEKESIDLSDTTKIDINNYMFQVDFPVLSGESTEKKSKLLKAKKDQSDINPQDSVPASFPKYDKFELLKVRPYERAFTANHVVTQLDNSGLNTTYQRFTGGGPIYQNPGLNAYIKIGIYDLFEDYKLQGGFRLTGDFNSIEYFVSVENLKKRLDKQFLFYKDSHLKYDESNVSRLKINDFRYILKWPFSERSSFRANNFIRYDKAVVLSTDYFNLPRPNSYELWLGTKLEYVFDNTVNKAQNIYYGTKLKGYFEIFKPVLSQTKTYLSAIGADIRHYQKIHRNLIWANRVAIAHSLGPQKIIYYVGGVNNWISPKFHNEITVPLDQNYIYQALALNMRGFKQNIRNGNKFAIINSELRFPIISYFAHTPVKSDFLRNFQLIGFTDVGTAWMGKSPFKEGNTFNTIVIEQNPVKATLTTLRNPIVMGYGTGVRSRILGYFLRLDISWGYDDNQIQKAQFYVSMSLDF